MLLFAELLLSKLEVEDVCEPNRLQFAKAESITEEYVFEITAM